MCRETADLRVLVPQFRMEIMGETLYSVLKSFPRMKLFFSIKCFQYYKLVPSAIRLLWYMAYSVLPFYTLTATDGAWSQSMIPKRRGVHIKVKK